MFDPLTGIVALAVFVFLFGLALAVLLKIVSGRISLRGLWTEKRTGAFSIARMQATVSTFAGAAALFGILGTELMGPPSTTAFASLDGAAGTALIGVLGGSQTVFLGAKFNAVFHFMSRLRAN